MYAVKILIGAVLMTLILEGPYVYFIMGYKSIPGIIGINVFSNVLFNSVLFIFMVPLIFLFDHGQGLDLTWLLFEFVIVPWIEISLYKKTNLFGLSNVRIIVNTYIANILSGVLGTLLLIGFFMI